MKKETRFLNLMKKGCITSVEMKIDLSDETPVQQNYDSLPQPLYPEIKAYIEDLLNRGWIVK